VQLQGKVAIVTGAASGIGRATARTLAARGAVVVAADLRADELATLHGEIGGSTLACDVRDPAHADDLVKHALTRHGRLDVVVANAGIGHAGPVAGMSDAEVAALVDLNVRGSLELARAFAASPDPRGIVFVTSIAGAVGVPGESVYSATKAAVEAFAVVLREELRPAGVGVSTVLPGVVETGFFDTRGVPYDRRVPRPVRPERVAAAVVRALERGTPRTVVPRWLAFPAWLSAALPGPYRALARRFS
jgi:NAD(P)-dependent dehydrogenase (short-subunit alcohol dehydrogenase family)